MIEPNGPTIEGTQKFIIECGERLKGPLSNTERALIVADRKDAREWLANRSTPPSPTQGIRKEMGNERRSR